MREKEIIEDIEEKEKDTYMKWNRATCIKLTFLVAITPSGLFMFLNLLFGAVLLSISLSLLIIFVYISGEYRKQDIAIKTAIWIVRHWVENKQVNTDFYKYTCSNFDDKYDNALSFLHENYNIDPNPKKISIVEKK